MTVAISLALAIGVAAALALLIDEIKAQVRRLAMAVAELAARQLPDERSRADAIDNWRGYVAFICDEERRHLKALWEALEMLVVAQRQIRHESAPDPAAALAGVQSADRRPRANVAELVTVERYIQQAQRNAVENGEPELVRDLGRLLAGVRRRVAPDGATDGEAKEWLAEAVTAIEASDSYPADILRRFLK
jgi:hypothetical protein